MRVTCQKSERTFEYAIELEAGDQREGRRVFDDLGGSVRLVREHWRVELPPEFKAVHPDRHAYALWLVVHPFVGTNLELPFAVSQLFAWAMEEHFGFVIGPIDESLSASPPPAGGGSALLFSGGLDSGAASLIVPQSWPLLFHDRIPLYTRGRASGILSELVQQSRLCRQLLATGRKVVTVRDDHEQLFDGYPRHHTAVTLLPYLYLADSLGTDHFEIGAVLGSIFGRGYDISSAGGWTFRSQVPESRAMPGRDAPLWNMLGLRSDFVIAGLSEVATALIVHRSELRGQTYSCFQSSFHGSCLSCDKCLRKTLLEHVFADREVPESLFDHFLSVPRIRDLFAHRFLGFHHVFAYAFQRMRCAHPVAQELGRQMADGPDLGLFARHYTPALALVRPAERPALERRLAAYVEPMTDGELAIFDELVVPPLDTKRIAAAIMEAGYPAPKPQGMP